MLSQNSYVKFLNCILADLKNAGVLIFKNCKNLHLMVGSFDTLTNSAEVFIPTLKEFNIVQMV